ncbi:Beta-lactamase precursor [Bacillus sp. THAF10]|uniref:serine hydrolase domain-containing protein n=1 Tax=Bacillus sp. THAF10 TaxID=2587848 RepID=UPI00126792E1|nr:serine hydrolase domain-containing protein [Bacillus sp. THAF10]QFT91052.1 Beta-lactamase precursor [Bacillus sp. THAF10]
MYKEYLQKLVADRDIPGGVLFVLQKKQPIFYEAIGSFTGANLKNYQITKDTLFDVASLTKVVATLPASLYLMAEGALSLEAQVKHFLPDFRHDGITIGHLLTHRSGLSPDLPFKDRGSQRDVLEGIYMQELAHKPGSQVAYSDLGMILLGKIIEKASGERLDAFVEQRIFTPWGLKNSHFHLPENLKALAASTEKYQSSFIQGEVHDEKAFQLGGVSGSAGLFSTAQDISTFAHHFLYPEEQSVIPAAWMRKATQHVQGNRGLGFEVWNGEGDPLSCGAHWPVGSFGHTGFTGTSIWMSPQDELVVVFLTNSVHYGRSLKIRTIRKKLHSLIYSATTGEMS